MATRVPTVQGSDVALSGPTGAQIATPQSNLLGGFLSAPKLADPQVQLDQVNDPQIDLDAIKPGLTQALASIPGQQAQQLGANTSQAGSDMDAIAQQLQLQTNAVVTDKAVNDAKEVAMRLQYGDGQNGMPVGFTQLKGWDAVNRPPQADGTKLALPDEYAQKYNDQVQSISDGLTNDAQRRAFAIQSGDIQTSLYGAAVQHQSQELQNYSLSVQEGTIATEKNNIGLNYTDPKQMAASMDRIDGAVHAQALFTGKSAVWADAQSKLQVADALEGALKVAASNNNMGQVTGLMNSYGNKMTPTALAEARKLVNTQMDTSVGLDAGIKAVASVAGKIGPPMDYTRLVNIVAGQESGNRDFNKDGSVVTSAAGAQGRMQVMPATAKALGAAPLGPNPTQAQMDDLAQRGQALLGQNVQRYAGDLGKAVAAYNSNPKTVDAAVKAAAADGSSWLSHMPVETQAYTTAIMQKMQTGQGAPTPPSWSDVQANVLAYTDPRTGQPLAGNALNIALTKAHEQFDYALKDQSEQRENLKAGAITQIVGTNGQAPVAYDQLPPMTKAALGIAAPELMELSKKVQEGALIPDNKDVMVKLQNDPYLASLNDTQMVNLKTQLSAATWQKFSDHRATLLNGDQGPGALNTPAIKQTTDGLLTQMGITAPNKPQPGDPMVARIATINQFVRDSVLTAQKQSGKKMSDADTEAFVNKLFSRNVTFKESFLGIPTGGSSPQRMMSMTADDLSSTTKAALTASFKTRGVPNPTDAQLLGAYWHNQPAMTN